MIDIADDPRFHRGIEYFNAYDFFEAHDEWEELWQEYSGDDRTFLQGLIQVAVCLHHFVNGNTRGAVKLYHSSRNYLEPYLPARHRVDLTAVLSQLAACCCEIIECTEQFPSFEISADLIPQIELMPAETS